MSTEKQAPFQWGLVGERASIRPVNPNDSDELNRLIIMEQWEEARWCVGSPIQTEIGMYSWINGLKRSNHTTIFAISGNNHSPESERLRLQGWVQLSGEYQSYLVARLNLNESYIPNPCPVEVSYMRYPSAQPHQIASALRQVCALVLRADLLSDPTSSPQRNMFARVDPRNSNSQHVLAAAGFELHSLGTIYDPRDKKKDNSLLYLLNWSKLQDILHDKADPFFLMMTK